MFVVGGIVTYSFYVASPGKISGILTFLLFSAGFSVIWAAAHQFRQGSLSRGRIIGGSLFNLALSVPPMLLGYDGLAHIADNLVIAFLLFAAAREYWLSRTEAPTPLYGLAFLYSLTALSFVLCAIVLTWNGQLVLTAAPDKLGRRSEHRHQHRQHDRHRRALPGASSMAAGQPPPHRCDDRPADRADEPPRAVRHLWEQDLYAADGGDHFRHRSLQGSQ